MFEVWYLFIYFWSRNLVDAANIAALAALLTFRRPECSLGGEDGQQVIVHPPEVSFANFLEIIWRIVVVENWKHLCWFMIL